MLFKYANKNTPFTLSPESLDWHLARGWYRMGSNIFTTHFLFFQQRPYSAIWIRIDLRDFAFSKRQRKLLRRNAKLFSTATGPRVIDEEREELYNRYAGAFDGRLSPTISDSLEDYDDVTVFSTWETTVRERVSNQLVATSYFDLGSESAASILGIFDPKLRSFSLGYYTMLLEIEHCLALGLRYYYPGYVVPGYERFDYKLRLGDSQYYDIRSQEWGSYADFDPEREGPVESQFRALGAFRDALARAGHVTSVSVYPLFEAGLYDIWTDDYFPYPYAVKIMEAAEGEMLVLAFDPQERVYVLLYCRHMVQTQMLFNASYLSNFDGAAFLTELIAVRKVMAKLATVDETVALVTSLYEIKSHEL